MSDGINLISSPALERKEACCDLLRVVGGEIEIRQDDHLAFAVALVSGFCYLMRLTPDMEMSIGMVCNKAMQQYFGSDTECEGEK